MLIILTLSSTTLIFASYYALSLKFAILVLVLAALILSLKLKSPFVSLFLIAIYTFQLINPSKFYFVGVLKAYEIKDIFFANGRILRYGIYLSDIFLVLATFFMISELLKKRSKKFLSAFLIKKPILKFVLFALGFLVFGAGISFLRSPFIIPSIVWTVQYGKVFLVAFLLFRLYLEHRDKFNLFYVVLCFSIFLQFFISVIQFLKQSPLGIPIEAIDRLQLPQASDVSTFYRASGTFGVSIQLALIMLIYVIILLPQAIEKKRILFFVSIFAAFAALVMTQGRIDWLAFALLIVLAVRIYFEKIKTLLLNKVYRRLFYYLILITSTLSFIFIPRFFLSFNTPYQGGGLPLRIDMIKEGTAAFFRNALLGYGAGTNEAVLYSLFPDGVMNTFPLPVLEGHIQFLLEFGVAGAFLFGIPFYIVARRAINFVTFNGKRLQKYKDFIFTFLVGVVLTNLHYLFQSHDGVVEFQFVGLILGIGMIAIYNES